MKRHDESNKYLRPIYDASCGGECRTIMVDVYSVLDAFAVTNPAVQHAIKKLLCPGQRGTKTLLDDLMEAKASIVRAIQMEIVKEDAKKK